MSINLLSFIQRNVVTKNLGAIHFVLLRSFASLWMTRRMYKGNKNNRSFTIFSEKYHDLAFFLLGKSFYFKEMCYFCRKCEKH